MSVSTRSVDRLIRAGLKVIGRRGSLALYSLTAARQLRAQLAKPHTTKYGHDLVSLLYAQTREAHQRHEALRQEFVPDDVWQPAWRSEVQMVATIMRSWPALLEQAHATRVNDPPDDEYHHALRPLLTHLAESTAVTDLGPALAPPAPQMLAPKPDNVADAKALLIRTRAALVETRVQIRAERWRQREELLWCLQDAIARARSLWWNTWPGHVMQDSASEWRRCAQIICDEAIAALAATTFRWGP
jgi:hypothetical protein